MLSSGLVKGPESSAARPDAAETTPSAGWGRRGNTSRPRDRVTALKGSRFALWKNPANLTQRQQAKLTWITTNEPGLWRGHQLKERLRLIFTLPADEAPALDAWLSLALRSRLPAFVDLGRKINRQREPILAAITHDMLNAQVESVNTKINNLTRRRPSASTPPKPSSPSPCSASA